MWQLKYNTIRSVNIRDYDPAAVQAWAPDDLPADVWQQRANEMAPFIAELSGEIVGFADLQDSGYIDHFFCHADHQGKGVGKALMEHIFSAGKHADISYYYSNVSITARPFFERFGFSVMKEQQVEINGVTLINFLMAYDLAERSKG